MKIIIETNGNGFDDICSALMSTINSMDLRWIEKVKSGQVVKETIVSLRGINTLEMSLDIRSATDIILP